VQDPGHSHWADSLIYGIGVHDVMISGPGLIDGSNPGPNGQVIDVLIGGDPREQATRDAAGVPGPGNKAIGLEKCTNIIFPRLPPQERRPLRRAWHRDRSLDHR